MKKITLFTTAALLSLSMSFSALAGEWKQNTTGWWYQNDNGTYPKNEWFQDIDSSWYYFNNDGYMQIEPITLNGITYRFNANGSCINPYDGVDGSIYEVVDGRIVKRELGAVLAERDAIDRATWGIEINVPDTSDTESNDSNDSNDLDGFN